MALLVTLVVAIACATWGGLSRGESDRTLFLFFGVTAPFGVLLLLGLVHQFMKYRRRHQHLLRHRSWSSLRDLLQALPARPVSFRCRIVGTFLRDWCLC